MKKILITGSSGRVGSKIVTSLNKKFDFVTFDLPEHDARSIDDLRDMAQGVDCIIHLAWDTKTDNYQSKEISLDNTTMFINIYEVALALGIPRVIMASSVHAGAADSVTEIFKSVSELSASKTLYGTHKQFLESLGRHYALRGLEVICLRLGGTCFGEHPDPNPTETHLWLSQADLIDLIDRSISHDILTEKFVIVPAISNNVRAGDSFPSNLLGWTPRNNAFAEIENLTLQ